MIQKSLSYGVASSIGMALAKLELLEKQGCKVEPQKVRNKKMIYNDCRDCKLYKGDCGHHFIDKNNHINYNIPTESRMDNVIGTHGSCFVASEQYNLETKKEVIEEIIRKYSVETIRMALKEKEKRG